MTVTWNAGRGLPGSQQPWHRWLARSSQHLSRGQQQGVPRFLVLLGLHTGPGFWKHVSLPQWAWCPHTHPSAQLLGVSAWQGPGHRVSWVFLDMAKMESVWIPGSMSLPVWTAGALGLREVGVLLLEAHSRDGACGTPARRGRRSDR